MRNIRRVLAASAAVTLLLASGTAAVAAAEQAGQCDGHNDAANVKVEEQDSPATVEVDEVMVTVTISGTEVSFTDADDEPIEVVFCLKASNNNGGMQSGSAGTVAFLNNGGETPEISNVVIYGLVPPNGDDDDDDDDDDDTEVGGALLTGSIDAICDTESDDLLVTGTATSVSPDLEVEEMSVALAGVIVEEEDDDEAETVLVELVRDGEVIDSAELGANDTVELTDTLALGDEASYELVIDGNVVDDAELESDCVEVLAEVEEREEEEDGTEEDDTRVLAAGEQLPVTGATALVLALLGFGALGAGAGTLVSTRRRV